MGIVQLPTPLAAQSGLLPATKKMVTTDTLGTVVSAGYLNSVTLEGYPIQTSDVLEMFYSYNPNTNTGTYGQFSVAISNGVITLTQTSSGGDVILPVVSGHFANFSGTMGSISDRGFLPSDGSKTVVPMLNATPTSGHVTVFTNVNGTIGDGGVLGHAAAKGVSDNTQPNVASIDSAKVPTVINDFAVFSDVAGTISDNNYSPSDSTKTVVVMVNAAPTVSHVAVFSDANGTIEDGGPLGQAALKSVSDNSQPAVASIFNAGIPFTVGDVATFADVNGTIQDGGKLSQAAFKAVSDNSQPAVASIDNAILPVNQGNFVIFGDTAGSLGDGGAQIFFSTTNTWGGGATSFSFNAVGCTVSTIVTANILSSTNNVSLTTVVPGTNVFTASFTSDPGANTVLQYILLVAS